MVGMSKTMQAAFDVFQGKISIEDAAKKYDVNLSELQKECKNLPNYLAGNSEHIPDNPPGTLVPNDKLKNFVGIINKRLFPKGDVFTTEQKLSKEDFEKINKEISKPMPDKPIKGGYLGQEVEYKGVWIGTETSIGIAGTHEGTKTVMVSSAEPLENSDLVLWTVERTVENPDGTTTKTITKNYFDMYTGELKATSHDNGKGKVDTIDYKTNEIKSIKAV